MNIKFILLPLLLIVSVVHFSCSPKARYDRKLKKELESGVRYDSLFMGLYLGMPEKDFYTHCWKLNRKGLIKQGSNNTTVQYITRNELRFPATMDFYPKFLNGKISEMPVRFTYTGWAPWNRELSSEKLQADVLNWYRKIYGGGFIEVRHEKKGSAFVKVNGNRRISLFIKDDMSVWAVFTDLLAVKDSKGFPAVDSPGVMIDTTKNIDKK
jgi:hypothetical protein